METGIPAEAYRLAREALLPYLPADKILARYAQAKGVEIASGKFASPESSAALAANAFGLFLEKPDLLELASPLLHAGEATSVLLERSLHFPWVGGTHPWLDVVIDTDEEVVAIESKRFEPFRGKPEPMFSEAYLRPVWGDSMAPFEVMRDRIIRGEVHFQYFNAAQIVKHAFGLRTEAVKTGKKAKLLYLFAEPPAFSSGKIISGSEKATHRSEVSAFAAAVADPNCDVQFFSSTYFQVIQTWLNATSPELRAHAENLLEAFAIS